VLEDGAFGIKEVKIYSCQLNFNFNVRGRDQEVLEIFEIKVLPYTIS